MKVFAGCANSPDRDCLATFSLIALGSVLLIPSGFSANWYLAPDGADTNPGTSNSPFATLMKA
jgi:hypothetical protein